MTVRNYVNNAAVVQTTGSITNVATSVTISDASTYPTSFPYTAVIDAGLGTAEIVLVTAAAANVLTVTRGYDGTSAQAHAANASFQHVAVKADYAEANSHVNASTNVHGLPIGSAVVGTLGAQSLFNKTLTAPIVNGETLTGTVTNTSVHTGNPALTGKSSVATTGKSLSLQNSAGVEKLSVLDTGDLATSGNAAITGTLTVGGSLYGTTAAIHVYTAGATWTKPANIKFARVRVVGAGAGGGGCTGAGTGRSVAGGGGSGGYSEALIPAASLLATETVTVGAAGAGAANGTGVGATGGTSSFGAHCSATGGVGGSGSTSNAGPNNYDGGAAGVGSGGDVNVAGEPGGYGILLSGTAAISGSGGSGPMGGGGQDKVLAGAGNVGGNYGGGGGGGHSTTTNFAGGNGAGGVVIVEEFYF